jgi:hypothetical protein
MKNVDTWSKIPRLAKLHINGKSQARIPLPHLCYWVQFDSLVHSWLHFLGKIKMRWEESADTDVATHKDFVASTLWHIQAISRFSVLGFEWTVGPLFIVLTLLSDNIIQLPLWLAIGNDGYILFMLIKLFEPHYYYYFSIIMALQSFVGPWPLFQLLGLVHSW